MDKEKLTELKHAIEKEAEVSEEIQLKRKGFESQIEGLVQKQKTIREAIDKCKDYLRTQAETEYTIFGLKKLAGGLGIRVGTSLSYDEGKALQWAKDHSLCLQLDKKQFEKIAKAETIDFVTKEEKVTVTFPKEIIIEG